MIRILFVAMMVASGSQVNAHEGKACCCCGEESDKSFRETVFEEVFPLTRELIEYELLVEEADFDDPRLRNRVTSPLREHRRLLRDLLSQPIDDDAPPIYLDSPADELTTKPFDQLVENDLLPLTLAEMRIPKGVESYGGEVMTFGGIAFCR